MRLTEFLSDEAVRAPLQGATKAAVLQELVEVACRRVEPAEARYVLSTVLDREHLMSTGIGHGIALPHGSFSTALGFTAALGIARQPIAFDAIDGAPVTLVFLLISDESQVNTKMRALARISRLLHREQFRRSLEACASATEAMAVITDEEARRSI